MSYVFLLSAGRVCEGIDGAIDAGEHQKKRLDSGNFKQPQDAIIHSRQDHLLSRFVAGNISANQRSEPGGVDVGNFSEIDNDNRRAFGLQCGLK